LTGMPEGGRQESWRRGSDTRTGDLSSEDDVTAEVLDCGRNTEVGATSAVSEETETLRYRGRWGPEGLRPTSNPPEAPRKRHWTAERPPTVTRWASGSTSTR
jgi:hypothetical protein